MKVVDMNKLLDWLRERYESSVDRKQQWRNANDQIAASRHSGKIGAYNEVVVWVKSHAIEAAKKGDG